MFYTVGEKYIYASLLLWYYRFTGRRARASAFIPWSLFSEAVYLQTKPKWNKCTFLGESIASREYVLSRFYMHKTVLRLLAGLWTLLVATIVFISNISFDNKGKAVTLFDILCWCFSNKLTLGVLVFKVDVVFFCSETYNKKCKNINFLSSFVTHDFQNNKTYLICNLCKRNVIIVFVSFTIVGAGTCVFQVWRQTLWRQWYTKFVCPLKSVSFLVFKVRILLVRYELLSKRERASPRGTNNSRFQTTGSLC